MKNTEPCNPGAMPAGESSRAIVLEIRGLGHVPGNFKNRKRAILDRRTGKMRTLTDPKVKKWMECAARSLEFQLSSMFQMSENGMQMGPCVPSSILTSIPLADSSRWIEIGYVRWRKVKKGEEGAMLLIEEL